jgi:hypothetical protein
VKHSETQKPYPQVSENGSFTRSTARSIEFTSGKKDKKWVQNHQTPSQWIGFRENLLENPIFNGKIFGFLKIFP